MATYLLHIKPLGTFFFGNRVGNSDYVEYYKKSLNIPQQTAILGMLRYFLLLNHPAVFDDNKVIDNDNAAKLIGPESFSLKQDPSNENDFGVIKKIYPVFLLHNKTEHLFRAAFDQKGENDFLSLSKNGVFENYNPKLGISNNYVSQLRFRSEDEIFKPQAQVGIRKDYGGKSTDDAFFINEYSKFSDNGFEFACYIELDTAVNFSGKNTSVELDSKILPFGGEQMPFEITIEPVEDIVEPKPQNTTPLGKLVLTSDTYLPEMDEKMLVAAITKTKMLSFLSTALITQSQNMKSKKASNYELYEAGSVFYFNEKSLPNNLQKWLNNKSLRQIGYNDYIHI